MIFKGRKIQGLIFNNKNYSGAPKQLQKTISYTIGTKTEPSAGTEGTSGYSWYLSYKTDEFRLFKYNDLNNPLTSLPVYSFTLNYIDKTPITSIKLVHVGGEMFKIEGGTEFVTSGTVIPLPKEVYGSGKNLSGANIELCDENGNVFVSDLQILSSSSGASASSFISGTTTIENKTESKDETIDLILPQPLTGLGLIEGSRYPTRTGASALTITSKFVVY